MKAKLRKQKRLGIIAILTGIASLIITREATITLFLVWIGMLLILEQEVCVW